MKTPLCKRGFAAVPPCKLYILSIWRLLMNYNKKSIEDIEVAGKRVLCRCDFNVPTKEG